MTNKEKYKEIFGIDVDPSMCPTKACDDCPCAEMEHKTGDVSCIDACTYEWWNKEYEVNNNGKKETT